LAAAGCRTANWRDSLEELESDPIRRAALGPLAAAATLRTAAILLDQYQGALADALGTVSADLAAGRMGQAIGRLDTLLARAGAGNHLVAPFRVVLAGAPNVGKSSLMNKIMGYDRAIVLPTPGTTRDSISAQTAIDGWPVELIDTAGLRDASDPLEQEGVARTRHALAAADLVVWVVDGGRCRSGEDREVASVHPDALWVYNKSDVAATAPRPPGIWTSALTGDGVDALLAAVASRLVPNPPAPGEAVPFAEDQIAVLVECRAAVERGDAPAATKQLAALVAAGNPTSIARP
jgi:tRNA modification GTPase